MAEVRTRKKKRERTVDERNEIARLRRAARTTLECLKEFDAMTTSYIRATGMSQTRFSFEASGQVDFMRLLRDNRDFRKSTLIRVLEFVAGQGSQNTPDPLA